MSVTLYHHTAWEKFKGIMNERRIRESPDGRFGRGVYLTSLGPDTSEEEVIYNNWDDAEQAILHYMDRVEVIIEVRVQQHNVVEADSDRDIYVHRGEIPTNAITGTYRRDEKGKARKFRIS